MEAGPLPLILDDREWSRLETGLVQRAELLDAIMADLYGARSLLAGGMLPPSAIFDHDEYLRPVIGAAGTSPRLFTVAVDLGRNSDGQWKVISDRTQAPSGAGYAMQNRRVVSRVLPEVYQQAHLHRLTPFFQAMRIALVDAASRSVEDPRVVVLSPGTHSETAFDQAFVASLLGFPLLEGSDLTVRDGRVWMRVLGKLEQVDVILRRVDSGLVRPAGAARRFPTRRDRPPRMRPPRNGQCGQQHRLGDLGESSAAALVTRALRAAAGRAAAVAVGGHLVVRRSGIP